jgi:hypothetical protein
MNWAGGFAILAGWLMITLFERSAGVRRYLLRFAGMSILTAGMVAVIQGQF